MSIKRLLTAALALCCASCARPDSMSEPAPYNAVAPSFTPVAAPAEDATARAASGALSVEAPVLPSAIAELTLEPSGSAGISTVQFVTVTFNVTGVKPGSELVTEFIRPGGAPYERRSAPLSSTGKVEWRLPVAGTVIDSARMVGLWSAQLSLVGAPLTSRSFELSP